MNPMTPNQTQLRDIHLPEPVSWWPLAPGWWILMILIIILIAAAIILIPKLIRKLKHQPASKLALTEFKHIQLQYQSQQNNQLLVQALSVLLRRICMTYDCRQNTASLIGQQWVDKLNTINPQQRFSDESIEILLTAPYKKQHDFNAQKLLEQCEAWINHLPKEAVR
jgi:Domain of unknown function (DUF4381)